MLNFLQLAGVFAAMLVASQATMPATQTSTNVYHSDAMQVEFDYPSGFKAAGKTNPNNSDIEKLDKECTSLPLAAMDMRTEFNMIFLKRIDEGCLGKDPKVGDLGGIAQITLRDALSPLGEPSVSSSTDYEINGHSASMVTGVVKVPHSKGKNVIFASAACVIRGKNIACFQFLSNECTSLARLVNSSIKFADGPATPVIPSNLPMACKS